uniref:Acetyltransferase (GNAT) domain-containing protein n=1 Tax=Candidatus Kentrum sp. DK TaxID=2126562 RepID=A0A450RU03_9GAMM|nr:MAG: Acetyltransferase (GNAT) domain-containing protein [Candidatus Kentron sp. DK]
MKPAPASLMSGEISIIERLPTPDEYNWLRENVGWHRIDSERAEAALGRSFFSVCAIREEQLIGLGRIVGDGAVYFYVQDVIVLPEQQGKGIGHRIMERLMAYLDKNAPAGSGAFIGLMATTKALGLYRQYGLEPLPGDSPFLGLWRNGH